MRLTTIHGGYFKLDGGSMFGVVPKTIWNSLNPADEHNLATWSMRCLLIETHDRKILVDTGMGDKQAPKFFSHFQPHIPYTLTESLQQHGLTTADITDVFITHFHFDHVGGAVSKTPEGELVPTFPKATYWTNKRHYDWAYDPNERERVSFLHENFVPLREHSQLDFLDLEQGEEWLPGIRVHTAMGHTEKMMYLELDYQHRKLYYCADLLPSAGHIGLSYIMSYDIRPLETLKEKQILLNKAYAEEGLLYFEHDRDIECCSLTKDSRGKIVMDTKLTLAHLSKPSI